MKTNTISAERTNEQMRLNAENVEDFVKMVFNRTVEPELHEINIEFLSAYWRKLIEAGPGVAYGTEHEGTPSGFLLGTHTLDPMTGLKKCFEYFLYVTPEFRRTGAGLELIAELEQGARDDGCPDVFLGCNVVYKMKALGRLYRRLGYEILAESYRKRLM